MDATYNVNGGFKPTIKRFADLEGPDFFPTPGIFTLFSIVSYAQVAVGPSTMGEGPALAIPTVLEKAG